jgi:hypothetical protein
MQTRGGSTYYVAGLENSPPQSQNIRMHKQLLMALIFMGNGLIASESQAAFCSRWSAPTTSGNLPMSSIPEASGMAISRSQSGRVYWINDSGDKGAFYYTAIDGSGLTKVKIEGFRPRDTEAMTLTDCPEGPCLAIGDIGDNKSKRKDISLIFIKEQAQYPESVPVLRTITMKYPDGPHDAEAMVFLPSGDLLIVTKEFKLSRLEIGNAQVFTLSKQALQDAKSLPVTLKKLGELPIPEWLADDGIIGKLVTDMAVNTRRQVLGILTYSRVIEIPLDRLQDLSRVSTWKKDYDYSLTPFKELIQQESLAYWPDADKMSWSTEYSPPAAPIYSMTCEAQSP